MVDHGKIFLPWAPEITWPVVMETMKTFAEFCNLGNCEHICFENFLLNLLDSILVVWSSKYWQLWIFFLKILVSMETRVLLFTYIGINDYRPIQRFKKRAKKTLGVVKCILVTKVTRSVAMETEVMLDWFLQISPDL